MDISYGLCDSIKSSEYILTASYLHRFQFFAFAFIYSVESKISIYSLSLKYRRYITEKDQGLFASIGIGSALVNGSDIKSSYFFKEVETPSRANMLYPGLSIEFGLMSKSTNHCLGGISISCFCTKYYYHFEKKCWDGSEDVLFLPAINCYMGYLFYKSFV